MWFAGKWLELAVITLSEISQSHRTSLAPSLSFGKLGGGDVLKVKGDGYGGGRGRGEGEKE
jgi:hypothetical protein